jgi:hypothetical protein
MTPVENPGTSVHAIVDNRPFTAPTEFPRVLPTGAGFGFPRVGNAAKAAPTLALARLST